MTPNCSRFAGLFALNGQPARSDFDVEAFGLVAILIKLVAHHGDGDHQRADD